MRPTSQIIRFSPTGGNSLHAVRCVSLLNTQLAANQVNLAIAIANFAVTTLLYFFTFSLSGGITLWGCYYSLSSLVSLASGSLHHATVYATLTGLSSRAKCLSASNRRSASQALAIT